MAEPHREQDSFTEHYLRELEALRKEGGDFAERYPKVAARLRLEDPDNPDPHVERLVESFAFLAARIRRKLDDDFPELSDAMLEVLYPHLVRPIPSMAVVELGLDLEQSVPTSGRCIERGTAMLSKPVRGEPLRFRTTSPVTLWPIEVAEASVLPPEPSDLEHHPEARAALRIVLRALGEHPLGKLELTSLRFFLKGEGRTVADLYELLTADALGLGLQTGAGTRRKGTIPLPKSAISSCGFSEEEAILPYPRRSFSGYRLLQEYFAFPQKFHFVEIDGFGRLEGSAAQEVELRILLRREPSVAHASITGDNFSLGCVPVVNLFPASADPIVVTPYVSEHDVVADAQRPLDLEVYSVESVAGISAADAEPTPYAPFFSIHHGSATGSAPVFWHALRRASRKKGDEGTEVSIALVDLDLQRVASPDETLHVQILCTNRDVPFHASAQWGRGDDFRPEGVTGILSATCIHRPTRTLRPGLSGRGHWRLVSQLSLNYLSIVREGRSALREILRIYDLTGSPANRDQIEGIADVRSESTVRWLRGEFGSGFSRGTRTALVLDRDRFVGSSPMLFSAVVERFLALYCAMNSFSELVLETPQDHGEVHRWNPRAGERVLL